MLELSNKLWQSVSGRCTMLPCWHDRATQTTVRFKMIRMNYPRECKEDFQFTPLLLPVHVTGHRPVRRSSFDSNSLNDSSPLECSQTNDIQMIKGKVIDYSNLKIHKSTYEMSMEVEEVSKINKRPISTSGRIVKIFQWFFTLEYRFR